MKYILLFLCATILSGCSWWTNFYVINYSNEKIKVQFVYKSYLNDKGTTNDDESRLVYNVAKDGEIDTKSPILKPADRQNQTVTVELLPNQACYFGQVPYDFDAKDERERNILLADIQKLVVIKNKDTLLCTRELIPNIFLPTKQKYQYGLLVK
jgi:hypothetical protein